MLFQSSVDTSCCAKFFAESQSLKVCRVSTSNGVCHLKAGSYEIRICSVKHRSKDKHGLIFEPFGLFQLWVRVVELDDIRNGSDTHRGLNESLEVSIQLHLRIQVYRLVQSFHTCGIRKVYLEVHQQNERLIVTRDKLFGTRKVSRVDYRRTQILYRLYSFFEGYIDIWIVSGDVVV